MILVQEQSAFDDKTIREAEQAYYAALARYGFNSPETRAAKLRYSELVQRRAQDAT